MCRDVILSAYTQKYQKCNSTKKNSPLLVLLSLVIVTHANINDTVMGVFFSNYPSFILFQIYNLKKNQLRSKIHSLLVS